jgi:hypothetical protein
VNLWNCSGGYKPAALVLYLLLWLLLPPFRVVGIAVGGVLELVCAIILTIHPL